MGLLFWTREAFKVVIPQPSVHGLLVFFLKLKLLLRCHEHGASIEKRLGCFVLDVASCITPLIEYFPVVDVECRRSGLVHGYHFGVLAYHRLVEHLLPGYNCHVAVGNQPQYCVK